MYSIKTIRAMNKRKKKTKIKNCPFCGEKVRLWKDREGLNIRLKALEKRATWKELLKIMQRVQCKDYELQKEYAQAISRYILKEKNK